MRNYNLVCPFLAIFFLWSCSNPHADENAKKFIEEAKARAPKPIESMPDIKELPKATYSASGMRDPYQRLMDRTPTANNQAPDIHRPKGALEAYTLDSLKMLGIVQDGAKSWAIIMTPDQLVYRLSVGDYLGHHFGRIVAIENGQARIQEHVEENGQWVTRDTSIAIASEDHEAEAASAKK